MAEILFGIGSIFGLQNDDISQEPTLKTRKTDAFPPAPQPSAPQPSGHRPTQAQRPHTRAPPAQAPPTITPTPIQTTTQQAQQAQQTQQAQQAQQAQPTTFEFNKGNEIRAPNDDVDTPQSNKDNANLRAFFEMGGTDYFNKMFAIAPIDVEDKEWAHFDYVPPIDVQNILELDNLIGDNIRYKEPLFYPKYAPPLQPPTRQSIVAMMSPAINVIQIHQKYQNKFNEADMGRKIDLSKQRPNTVRPIDFYKIKIFNPV